MPHDPCKGCTLDACDDCGFGPEHEPAQPTGHAEDKFTTFAEENATDILDADGVHIARTEGKHHYENAEFIVLCMNACEGIDSSALQDNVVMRVINKLSEAQLTLEAISSLFRSRGEHKNAADCLKHANGLKAAILKATRKN